MGGLSIWHWLIVLLIVVLVFGTKRLKNIGTDMGGALKGFREAMNKGEDEAHREKDAAQLQRDSSVQDTAAAKPLDGKDRQSS